ncbi:cytidylyltransferase domain-containing protein [Clostridium sporogenes]|uniref:cytidylyltransferase domain-containing protein n=1 Tax=Clostridium sporogenes TaxID=1509 RepID=UPI001C10284B|nr:glycosyltransferase family protein [Clostridium sporogenes]MBU5299944.1 glycosyltransferase family protein [Clostridium sporogenes]
MVGVIIQSRMGSTRLPGKSLKKIQGKPLLYYSVMRAKLSKYIDGLVVATTVKHEDDSIEEWCLLNDIECFRGSEEDVLDRYYQTALKYKFEIIVRVTADDPFIDPKIIDLLITNILNYDKEFITMRNKTNTWPYGLDVEVFTFNALKKAWEKSTTKSHKEHVTTYIIENMDSFKTLEIPIDEDLSDIRLTVDYEKDFIRAEELLSDLITEFGIDFSWRKVVNLYKQKNYDTVE